LEKNVGWRKTRERDIGNEGKLKTTKAGGKKGEKGHTKHYNSKKESLAPKST